MAARIEMNPAVKIDDAGALSRVYTPGVAEDCRAVAEDPAAVRVDQHDELGIPVLPMPDVA